MPRSGGAGPRRKGSRAEREVVKLLNSAGMSARRVPLSGAVAGYDGDIACSSLPEPIEVKVGAQVPVTVLQWLDGKRTLFMRRDRGEWIVAMRWGDFQEMYASALKSAAESEE